ASRHVSAVMNVPNRLWSTSVLAKLGTRRRDLRSSGNQLLAACVVAFCLAGTLVLSLSRRPLRKQPRADCQRYLIRASWCHARQLRALALSASGNSRQAWHSRWPV